MQYNKKTAFTLVELIVVITILAILWTIAFISLQSYTSMARNALRMDGVSKIATTIHNQRLGGVSLLAFGTTGREIPGANVAWVELTPWVDYIAWTIKASVLDIKPEDFQDPSTESPYFIGATTKKKGQYEVVTTLEEWWSQKAQVSGIYEKRLSTALTGTGVVWTNKFKLSNPTDLNTLILWDVIESSGLPTGSFINNISSDWLSLFLNNDFTTTSNSIQLASEEIDGLVVSVDGLTPVTNWWFEVAYNIINIPIPVYGTDSNSFVSVWETSSDNEIIHFPLDSGWVFDFTIDWWDGSTEDFGLSYGWSLSHTYASAGRYIITIDWVFDGLSFRSANPQITAVKLMEIQQWGDVKLWVYWAQFKGAENVVFTAQDQIDTSNVLIMTEAFDNAINFNSDIWYWDTSQVTHMSSMFYSTSFNQDIRDWDTSKVRRMNFMFRNNPEFNQDIGGWDTGEVERIEFMFEDAIAFNQDIWDWDTGEVTNMSFMFDNATAFDQDIWDWDTGEVTNMIGMFRDANSFNKDLNLWDTIKVLDMSYMFLRADNFNGNISGWNTSSVENMSYMFRFTDWFNQDISGWNTWSVQQMQFMFRDTTSFDQDIWDWDVSAVIDYADFDAFSNPSWTSGEKPNFPSI